MFRKKDDKTAAANLLCKQNTNGNTNAKQTAQEQKMALFLLLVDWSYTFNRSSASRDELNNMLKTL